ncbi:MAG: Sulfur acceptor protein CsdE [Chlamydiae bacterium]|nr:Sulfur acceptor protein CsdE [Chlamydiota bacterium]
MTFVHFFSILGHMKDFSMVKNLFKDCFSQEDLYQKIIALGRNLPPLDQKYKIPENIVKGCQSIVYLHTVMEDGKLFFHASSDALISSGLAALLIKAYNGEPPETVLQHKPTFLEDLQIYSSLTPGRSNGLASMFLRMQQDALKFLVHI